MYMNMDNYFSYALQNTLPKYLERWANVYTLVNSIPADNRFEMSTWATQRETACNTAACAAGHAALHPWFIDHGFEADYFRYDQFTKAIHSIELAHNAKKFFGYSYFSNCPFSPMACRYVLNKRTLEDLKIKLSPGEVASVTKKYMESFWGAPATETAIANATATYDVEHVHVYAPWNIKPKESTNDDI